MEFTGDRRLLDFILTSQGIGYGTKLFSLAVLTVLLGHVLNWAGRLLFELAGSLLSWSRWYKSTALLDDFFTAFISDALANLESYQ